METHTTRDEITKTEPLPLSLREHLHQKHLPQSDSVRGVDLLGRTQSYHAAWAPGKTEVQNRRWYYRNTKL